MTDETKETQEVDESQNDGNLSHEDALKVIKQLRTENASRRVKVKEIEEKAAKWEQYELAQKSEIERLMEENARLKETNEATTVEKLRKSILAEFKLDAKDEVLLKGTEEEMRALAARLAEKASEEKSQTTNTDFYAGQRGGKVSPQAETLDAWFNNLWAETEGKSRR